MMRRTSLLALSASALLVACTTTPVPAKAGSFVTVDDAVAQQADVVATYGVAQVVDLVLMPPKK